MNKITKLLISVLLLSGCSFVTTSESSNISNQILDSINNSSILTTSSNSLLVSHSDSSSISSSSLISTNINYDDREAFYEDYIDAISYEDSQKRTTLGYISGSLESHNEKPNKNTVFDSSNNSYRFTNANYHYDNQNKKIAYDINTLDGTYKTIYYNAGYIHLEEVAAYILAFGEVPPNNNYYKDNKDESISKWGEYGRVNIGKYSNNITKYPFEPELPLSDSTGKTYKYIETDIGLQVGFTMSNGDYVGVYNNGRSIARGVCRIVFTASYSDGSKIDDINERHVFYTYNHYNDFQEYLNYYGGWSNRFGNETSGNPYCSNKSAYNNLSNAKKPTSYIKSILVDKNTIN